MKGFIAVCLMACVAVALARPEDAQYTDRYDGIDIDEIVQNRRLLIPYVKCLLDQGRCAPEGKELKLRIADALQTKCSKCTAIQRDGTRKVIGHLINNEPDYWNQLSTKYDPEHKYVVEYEAELKTVKP